MGEGEGEMSLPFLPFPFTFPPPPTKHRKIRARIRPLIFHHCIANSITETSLTRMTPVTVNSILLSRPKIIVRNVDTCLQ